MNLNNDLHSFANWYFMPSRPDPVTQIAKTEIRLQDILKLIDRSL
jgi:hypothetical protein